MLEVEVLEVEVLEAGFEVACDGFHENGFAEDDAEACASGGRWSAGSCRCRSRSFIHASYLAVPGRGGASGGRPPAHCGT